MEVFSLRESKSLRTACPPVVVSIQCGMCLSRNTFPVSSTGPGVRDGEDRSVALVSANLSKLRLIDTYRKKRSCNSSGAEFVVRGPEAGSAASDA